MPRERRPFFVGLPPSRGAVRFFTAPVGFYRTACGGRRVSRP